MNKAVGKKSAAGSPKEDTSVATDEVTWNKL